MSNDLISFLLDQFGIKIDYYFNPCKVELLITLNIILINDIIYMLIVVNTFDLRYYISIGYFVYYLIINIHKLDVLGTLYLN